MNGIQDRWPVSRTSLQRLGCTVLLAASPLAYAATLAVQPQAGEPASQVELRGAGMAPFEDVELRYDSTALGTARADASGVFKADDVVIPASALPGSRPIVAVGRSSGTRASRLFLVRTNWPQFHRGTFRHGETPHEQRLGPDNVARLRLLWGVPTGDPADPPLRGAPVLADGLVYVLTSSLKQGRLLALNAATGAQSWSRFTGFSAYCDASPAVAQGRVYAPASRRITAFDASTGAVRWRGSDAVCAASVTPTVLQGKLFTTFSGGPSLEARDAASGRLLWTRRICIGTPPACTYASVAGPLAAGDGIVYVTNHANGMAAYDMDSGRQLWSRTVGSGGIYSAPVVEGDVVYVSDHNGQLHALNRRTGAQLWSAPQGRFNHSTPALANGVLYAGGDSGLTAIDARTGAVRWVQSAVGTVVTSPAVANGVVYLGGGAGRLYALDALTGEVLHSRQIAPADRELVSSPMVADGVLYMNTGDRMLAFGL